MPQRRGRRLTIPGTRPSVAQASRRSIGWSYQPPPRKNSERCRHGNGLVQAGRLRYRPQSPKTGIDLTRNFSTLGNMKFPFGCTTLCQLAIVAQCSGANPLPDTAPLVWPEEDLSERLMNGAHAFVERKISEAPLGRDRFWNLDFTSPDAYTKSIAGNRERFRKMIGVVDSRLPPRMERFGDDANPALVAETDSYQVLQVRWPVLDGVDGEGLLLRPRGKPKAFVVFLPDADTTPEQVAGLTEGASTQIPNRLAAVGVEVVIPMLINRQKLKTDDARLKRSDQTHREWIYRQAFQMGRHIIGYEVQRSLAVVDWFASQQRGDTPIGIIGYGEGGLIAFYAAALDERIQAACVSGYFQPRQNVWTEPIYRNIFGLLREFGDAEVADLIAPRKLLIEHSKMPVATGHKGDLPTTEFDPVAAELKRVQSAKPFGPPKLFGNAKIADESFQSQTVQAFLRTLSIPGTAPLAGARLTDTRTAFDPGERHEKLFRQLESHVQGLVRKSEHVRDAAFLNNVMPEFTKGRWSTLHRHDTLAASKFIAGAKPYREKFHRDLMGRFDEKPLPPNPRSRQIIENDKWTAHDVVLDVYPELYAWGTLLLPKDLKHGEKRPVVVCQHGRQGLPRDTIDAKKTAYNDFAARLAERGFITFAPHNLYRFEDRYRWLDRKANTIGATLFTFIIDQHAQILRWLKTQPFVDGERIAFYGLSYGGETAVRVPSILEDYCLSICSGDFNQWTRKVAATDQPFSFMTSIEWEMPYWNLGNTFDYAEMAYLIFPRPFMVERGHWDLVGRDQWVAHEYGKVRWLYAQFGLSDRTEIEYFQGGHSINGEGTFRFLHKHLNWPEPRR